MKLRNLIEEFIDSFKSELKSYVEVFKNPTAKEMNNAAILNDGIKYIRFIADSKKNELYAFSPVAYHYEVQKKLDLPDAYKNISYLWGVAYYNKNKKKWILDSSDTRETATKKTLKENFGWIEKWISLDFSGAELKDSSRSNVFPGDFNKEKEKR